MQPDSSAGMSLKRFAWPIAAAAMLIGIGLRLSFLDYETTDVPVYLGPWYEFARRHGLGALGTGWTNYTPLYGYLLIAASWFDAAATPLTLIKFISYPFELGSALIAGALVRSFDPRPERAALAFAATWLAPSVLHNGALWGQCDSIWTFFLLLSLLLLARDRPGFAALAFGAAISVKLQAVFLGPLLLALAIRRELPWPWLAAAPLVYVVIALPELAAGRPLADVLTIYLDQAGAYRDLSKGAANLYLLIPNGLYGPGVVVGLVATTAAGLAFATWVGRAQRLPVEHLLLAAALSLALVPFLLPKMHDRYFYPFELLVLTLACARPILLPVALLAQVSSILCTIPFDGRGDLAQPVTGLQSLLIVLYLTTLLGRAFAGRFEPSGEVTGDRQEFVRPTAALWIGFVILVVAWRGADLWIDTAGLWPKVPTEPLGMAAFLVVVTTLVVALPRAASEQAPALAG